MYPKYRLYDSFNDEAITITNISWEGPITSMGQDWVTGVEGYNKHGGRITVGYPLQGYHLDQYVGLFGFDNTPLYEDDVVEIEICENGEKRKIIGHIKLSCCQTHGCMKSSPIAIGVVSGNCLYCEGLDWDDCHVIGHKSTYYRIMEKLKAS